MKYFQKLLKFNIYIIYYFINHKRKKSLFSSRKQVIQQNSNFYAFILCEKKKILFTCNFVGIKRGSGKLMLYPYHLSILFHVQDNNRRHFHFKHLIAMRALTHGYSSFLKIWIHFYQFFFDSIRKKLMLSYFKIIWLNSPCSLWPYQNVAPSYIPVNNILRFKTRSLIITGKMLTTPP